MFQPIQTDLFLADVLTLHFHYPGVGTLPFPSDNPKEAAEAAAAVAAARHHTDHLDNRPALPWREDSAAPRSVDHTPVILPQQKRTAAVRTGLLAGLGRTLIVGEGVGQVDVVERVGGWAWMRRWPGLRARLC